MAYGYCKPTAVILCYPVLSGHKYGHVGTLANISGGELTEEMRSFFSVDEQIDERSSPAFLVHTVSDDLVPVENAFLAMKAYRQANVPFEAHIFPYGPHGLALANSITSEGKKILEDESYAKWVAMADEFMRRF